MKGIRIRKYSKSDRQGHTRLDWLTAGNVIGSGAYAQAKALRGDEILLSLEGIDYFNPDGLIWLLLLGQQLASNGNRLHLELPHDLDRVRTLAESNFDDVAKDVFSVTNRYALDEYRRLNGQTVRMFFYRVCLDTVGSLRSRLDSHFQSEEFARTIGISRTDQIAFEFLPGFMRAMGRNQGQSPYLTTASRRGRES